MKNENDSNLTDEKIQVDLGKERKFSQKQILCFILLGVVFILFRIVFYDNAEFLSTGQVDYRFIEGGSAD